MWLASGGGVIGGFWMASSMTIARFGVLSGMAPVRRLPRATLAGQGSGERLPVAVGAEQFRDFGNGLKHVVEIVDQTLTSEIGVGRFVHVFDLLRDLTESGVELGKGDRGAPGILHCRRIGREKGGDGKGHGDAVVVEGVEFRVDEMSGGRESQWNRRWYGR